MTFLALEVNPPPLAFTTLVGSSPSSQSLNAVSNEDPTTEINFAVSSDQSWLLPTPAAGLTPHQITVAINSANLAAGSYTGHVTLTPKTPTPFIDYFIAAGCDGPQIPNFTTYPTDVYLGWFEQGPTWNEVTSGTKLAYTPGDALIVLGRSFSSTSATPGLVDTNGNVWTQRQAYAANSSGMFAFTATANNNLAVDQFNFSPGSTNAGSLLAVIEVAQAAGSYTVSYGSSNTGTISVTTPSGYTLSLACLAGAELIVFEWGGGVAGHTYRIAYLTQMTSTTVLPSGWNDRTLTWFSGVSFGSVRSDGFFEFSDVLPPAVVVPVTLTVNPVPHCQLAVSPSTLNFSQFQCEGQPAPQTVQITNSGDGTPINFTVTADQPWVKLTPSSGTTPATLTVAVNISGLAPGTYNSTISFSSNSCGNPNLPVISIVLSISPVVVAACIPDPNADAEGGPSLNGVFSSFVASGTVTNPPGFPAGTYHFQSFTQAGPDVYAFGGELYSTLCGREKIVMVVPDHYDDDGVGIDWQYEPWLAQVPPNVLQHAGFRAQLQGHGVIRMTPLNEKQDNSYKPSEVLLSIDTPVSFEKGLRATEKFLGILFSNKKVCGAFAVIQEIVQYANPKYAGSRSPKK